MKTTGVRPLALALSTCSAVAVAAEAGMLFLPFPWTRPLPFGTVFVTETRLASWTTVYWGPVVEADVVLAALDAHRIVPRTILEVGSTEAIKRIVAAGFGIAIVSAAAAADQITLGRLVILKPRNFVVRRMLTRLRLPARQPSAPAAAFDALLDRPVGTGRP